MRAASRQPGVIFVLKEALTLILPFYFLILKVISFYLFKLGSINKEVNFCLVVSHYNKLDFFFLCFLCFLLFVAFCFEFDVSAIISPPF